MQITLVKVKNYRALKEVEVRPGERNLVIVGGNNRAGKTSLLSALEVAFGGAKETPPEPVRFGTRKATIHVELDGGDLVIDRVLDRAGKHKLDVRTKDGKQKAPQTMLDALVGARFLDPLHFLYLAAKAQRELLLKVADIGIDLDENAAKRAKAFDERRDVNRDVKRLEGSVEELGDDEEIPDVQSADELMAELDEKRETVADYERNAALLGTQNAEGQRLTEEIEALKQRRAEVRDRWKATNEAMQAVDDVEATRQRCKELAEEAITISKSAGAGAAAKERNERRAEQRAFLKAATENTEKLSATIVALDVAKADALAEAKMPIPGLEVDEEQVTYNGAPLEQAADSERLRISLALAAALSPELRDIFCRDGSLCDDDSMAAIERFAKESGCQIWLERVGDRDDDALIIEEGEVRE